MIKVLVLSMALVLSGCAGTLGALGALSSAATPKVSADLQIGDKKTDANVSGTTIGKTEKSTQNSTIKKVQAAKKAEVDQSLKKEDKKTEIGEVAGSVQVNQGPDKLTLVFLAMGWPLFVGFLLFVILRRVRNVRAISREALAGDAGT